MRETSILLIILALIVMLSLVGCRNKEKTTVLTNDVKQETAMQEDEIKKIIIDGANFLNEGKYDDAKSTFEKAISMDKANKGAYIEIKNKYLEKERLDDAYYIIKLAISNNVDTENMKVLLNELKLKFEPTKLEVSLYKNKEYTLPTKIKAKINNAEKEVEVVWNNTTVDASKVGEVKYEGRIEQYDRAVELYLEILETRREKKTGYITKVYEEGEKRYITMDEIEFYFNEKDNNIADREAAKDGVIAYEGVYYIRNNNKALKSLQVAQGAKISLCGYRYNLETLVQKPVNFEELKNQKGDLRLLCHFYLENNVVVKIEEQYVP